MASSPSGRRLRGPRRGCCTSSRAWPRRQAEHDEAMAAELVDLITQEIAGGDREGYPVLIGSYAAGT